MSKANEIKESVKKEIDETTDSVKKEISETTESVKKFGKSLWKKVKISIGILLILALLGGSYFVFSSYSQGYRTGTVMKISKKGVAFKTWEGQLNAGGLQNTESSDMATTVWEFSVSDDHIVRKIEKAVDNGSRVKLLYKEKYFQLDFFGDTKYFVYDVEEVPGND